MKKYIPFLLLFISFFSVKSYTQLPSCTQDTTPPELTCSDGIEVTGEPYACAASVIWMPPLATDNCDSITVVSSNFSPGDWFPIGTTIVSYAAIDSSGNTAECSFDVTVIDGTPPLELNCPTYIEVSADTSGCGSNLESSFR